MTDKKIETKISERVAELGIFGEDANKLVKFATDSAETHIFMGGDPSAVVHCVETFIREGIVRFDLGSVIETHDNQGHHYRFERKPGVFR